MYRAYAYRTDKFVLITEGGDEFGGDLSKIPEPGDYIQIRCIRHPRGAIVIQQSEGGVL